MNGNRKGFTLIELVVVVMIMGILASIGVPYYYKTVETSKATDSVAIGHMLANAYRMFQLDNPSTNLSGQVTNTCNGGSCSTGDTSACRLVRCNYIARQDWGASAYNFFVGSGNCGGTNLACTRRGSGASANYSGWGYNFTNTGGCSPLGSSPDCPKF
ncbi:MAG: prepilin-type N-terminal cleavage/methylation domain-containing protein [Elusimicrobia bacterium]|nr:prepilin-type N-terminal cleavage/methylation domain-containing protein [Elusimicrobiota bacterium]